MVELLNDLCDDYYSYRETVSELTSKGYKDLGWLNDGIKIPSHYNCSHRAYRSENGSTEIMVDLRYRVFYSVDMGD